MRPAAVLICVFVKKAKFDTAAELLEVISKDYSLRRLKRAEEADPCDSITLASKASVAVICCLITIILFSFANKVNMEKQQKVLTPLGYSVRAKVAPTDLELAKLALSERKENSDLNKVTNDQKERPQASGFRFRRGFLNKRRNSEVLKSKAVSGSAELNSAVPSDNSLVSAVDFNRQAQKMSEGNVSLVYKLFRENGEAAAIFKPYEPLDTMPEDDEFTLNTKDQCLNEVVAYRFDQQMESGNRAGVPETKHVKLPSTIFGDEASTKDYIKGSLQQFVDDGESCDDYGPSLFKRDDVHRIGVLDLRILNCDRHTGNMLFSADTKSLVPIDHALSFPEIQVEEADVDDLSATLSRDSTEQLYLKNINFEWMMFPQAKEPFSEDILEAIEKIDIDQQLDTMRKAKMSTSQKMAVYASTLLMKMGALKFNKTLFELGSIVQRTGARREPSVFEMLVSQTLDRMEIGKEFLSKVDENSLKEFATEFAVVTENYFRL